MVNTIFLLSFLMVFSYNGYADSVMSSDENSSDVEKPESVSQPEDSSLNEYAEDIETFDVDERPDGHAPIGIKGDHVHEQGEFMISFRLMMMRMEHKLERMRHMIHGSIPLVIKDVNMDMWMGMLGLMYGLTNRWTAMAMVPYSLYNVSGGEVDHGFGDISLSVLYAPLKEDSYRMVLSLEAFFPTGLNTLSGTMKEKWARKDISDNFFDVMRTRSAYAFLPQLSALFYWDKVSLGFQMGFKYFIRTISASGFEDMLEPVFNMWGAYNLSENFSMSLRGAYQSYGIAVFSKASSFKHSEHSFFSYLGVNFIGTDFLEGHRLAFEAGLPVSQSTDIEMERSFVFHLGWQKAF